MGGIALFHYVTRRDRLCETGPAGAAVEFVLRTEKRLSGNNIDVNSRLVIVPIGVVKRSFRATLTRHVVLVFGQLSLQFSLGWYWLG